MKHGKNTELNGYLLGLLGVMAFGGTLPATRILALSIDPVLITLARASVAGLAALLILAAGRMPLLPPRAEWQGLAIVVLTLVLGFPLMMAVAMAHVPASHGAVMLGILPLVTAAAGCLFSPERPSLGFWLVGALGSATVIAFALLQGGGALAFADFALLLAFLPWYIGLAMGGIARVSQLMLLLPFFTIAIGHLLIGEALDGTTIVFCVAVAVIVLISKRMPIRA